MTYTLFGFRYNAIIEKHCLDEISEVTNGNGSFSNINYLLNLFKDADAFDQVRINDLNEKYQRNIYSKRLIQIAWFLYNTTTSPYQETILRMHLVNLEF